ncbi:tetratricopeptide repeat protein [Pyxidicoccus fallax]|uniref:Tetratricopeptide repeat protein n=2 Tax=Pyxidicoccus fallax TaxID=394095 RepID=A0A848LYW8_9BACT|nr:tetratricopeptide repeat protein [Pyxidicoccus fallax]NPC86322.1 tetratricopeptide repeat protein [Pyxidicoccus fallax]
MLAAADASAGPPRPSATAAQEDPKAAARELFDSSQREYDLGNFEEALNGYSEAYRLVPEPALLFNIGQCHRQLGQYERAAFFYRRYLALEPDSPDAPVVRELIATVEAKQAEQERAEAAKRLEASLAPRPAQTESKSSGPGLLRNRWFWVGVGIVAAGAATTTVLLTRSSEPRANLGTVTVP